MKTKKSKNIKTTCKIGKMLLAIFLISQLEIFIDITSPKYEPLKIHIKGNGKVKNLVEENLSVIGYFSLTPKNDAELFVEIENSKEGFLFTGKLGEDEIFKVLFRSNDPEAVANSFSNYIIRKLTGVEANLFGKPMIFISDKDGKKEVWFARFPFRSPRKIVSTKTFITSADISPDGTRIAYTTLWGKSYRLFVADLKERKIWSPVAQGGMFISPRFFTSNLLTVAWNNGKVTRIYLLNIENKKLVPLTAGPSDIVGEISPDGELLVFASGRFGNPQIFLKTRESEKSKRITFTGAYNTYPSFSPDGKEIVFCKMENNVFNIYIWDISKNKEREVVKGYGSAETPTFTPDGQFIVFASNQDGDWDLYITDRFGNFVRKIKDTPFNEYMPRFP